MKDIEERNKLVEDHLYMIDILIRKYLGKGVEYDDLYQVGALALVNAADRYNPEKGFEFKTFAAPTILGEIKKYYPAYYQELREYLILNMKKDEEGYYYSAIQEEGKPPVRSKYLYMFEMDHIVPISKGGLTVKENLQMIFRTQNIAKGAK